MTEQETTPVRKGTEYESITMEDGRVVLFPGKMRLKKDILIEDGKPAVRFDLRNGQTITCFVPEHHIAYAAGHGYSQKVGDSLAGAKDDAGNPISDEDRFVAIEAMHSRLCSGSWDKEREGGTGEGTAVAGAHLVLRAVSEVRGVPVATVKAYIENKLVSLEQAWEAGGKTGRKPTRRAIYEILRDPDTEIGRVYARLAAEKGKAAPAVSADDLLSDL